MVKKKLENKEAKEAEKQIKDSKKPDYRIYGVRKKTDFIKVNRQLPRYMETMVEKGGCCCIIYGPPGSGKGNLLSNWFLRDEFLKDLFDGGTYFISPTIHSDITNEYLKEYFDFIEDTYSEELAAGIYENIMSVDKEDRQLSALVFDDCLKAFKINSIMNKIVSTNRHMKSLIFLALQAVKGIPPQIRANCSHSVIFHQPSKKEFVDLVELHSFFGGEQEFIKNYHIATDPKYGFLIADWRDLKLWAHGAELDEPKLLWSKYDENGNLTKVTEYDEPNKPTMD